jgi:micrococcal nuclease
MRHLGRKTKIRLLSTVVAIVLLVVGQHFGWFGAVKNVVVQNDPNLYTVTRFVDGDTIEVDMDNRTEKIRMIGIDTPETHKPNAPVQCYGVAAAAYTKNLIGTQKIRLQSDPQSTNRDRYNRLLRYVYMADGRLVEEELIKNGYGFAYTQFPFTKSADFVAAQRQAQHANKGLWGNCNPYQQSSGRWQTEDL